MSHTVDDRAHLVDGRPVAQADRMVKPELVARRQRFDAAAGNLSVGHAEHRSIERADACRPEPDVVHGPHRVAELEKVSHAHRLVEDQRKAGDDVLERLLGGERDGNAADPQPGERRRRIEAEIAKRQRARRPARPARPPNRRATAASEVVSATGREAPAGRTLRRSALSEQQEPAKGHHHQQRRDGRPELPFERVAGRTSREPIESRSPGARGEPAPARERPPARLARLSGSAARRARRTA